MKSRSPASAGFTLLEVLVTISVIAILAGVAGAIGRVMTNRSHGITCMNNLRDIGAATMLYAGENNMTLPVTSHQRRSGGKSWTLTLQPYTGIVEGRLKPLSFKCPADEHKTRDYTYLINDFLTPNPAGAPDLNFSHLSRIGSPEETLLFAEASVTYLNSDHFHFSGYHGTPVPISAVRSQVNVAAHGATSNYLFADGHVEALGEAEVARRLEQPGSKFIDPSAR